jgi:hypothetical protein
MLVSLASILGGTQMGVLDISENDMDFYCGQLPALTDADPMS